MKKKLDKEDYWENYGEPVDILQIILQVCSYYYCWV